VSDDTSELELTPNATPTPTPAPTPGGHQRPSRTRAEDRRRRTELLRTIGLIVIAVVAMVLAVLALKDGGR
jgi:hypothetical protein